MPVDLYPTLLDQPARVAGAFRHSDGGKQTADPYAAVPNGVGRQRDDRDILRRLAARVHALEFGIRGLAGSRAVIDRHDLARQPPLYVLGIRAAPASFLHQRIDLLRRDVRAELEVGRHHLVRDRHQFAVHRIGRFGDADVVSERLAHLLDAVQADEKRHEESDLRVLTFFALQITPGEDVQRLILPPHLHVGLDGD